MKDLESLGLNITELRFLMNISKRTNKDLLGLLLKDWDFFSKDKLSYILENIESAQHDLEHIKAQITEIEKDNKKKDIIIEELKRMNDKKQEIIDEQNKIINSIFYDKLQYVLWVLSSMWFHDHVESIKKDFIERFDTNK